MISSISFFNKLVFPVTAFFLWVSACASVNEPLTSEKHESPVIYGSLNIAVLPISNLSGTPAPVKEIRESFLTRLEALGIRILNENDLESFMARHRLRYTGGIERETGRAFKEETGVEAVLITSLELFSETAPPKIALSSRLVATGNKPTILWIDSVGLAGDDSPGLLDLSLIKDPLTLKEMAIEQITASFVRFLSGRETREGTGAGGKKFRPEVYYRSPIMDEPVQQTIAVVPFLNLSERKFAGEIMPLHFVRLFREFENFQVIEPGMVRDTMLRERMIMVDGISLADADIFFDRFDADLVLSGRVMHYQDYQGGTGQPVVDFSTLMIHRQSREVVWSSHSYHRGDEAVYFFGKGKVKTAHRLAFEMAASVANLMTR